MIYTITSVFLCLFSILTWRTKTSSLKAAKRKRGIVIVLLLISSFFLVLHDGLRWEIGTDWDSYLDAFESESNLHMDMGYSIFMRIVKSIFDNFSFFILIIAIITYSVVSLFFYRYSLNPLMSLCIYYCTMIGLLGCNRQILALMICIMSLKFVFERKPVHFLAVITIAFLFHKTAILFLPSYFIYGRSFKPVLLIGLLAVSFLIGITRLIDIFPLAKYLAIIDAMSTGTDFSSYIDDNSSVSLFGSLKRIVFVALSLLVRKRYANSKFDFFLTLYIIGCCIYLCFNGSSIQLLAGRGALYYNFYECIIIPLIVSRFPVKGLDKRLVWIVLFGLYVYLMWRDMNSYVNLIGIDIYNPYKSIIGINA